MSNRIEGARTAQNSDKASPRFVRHAHRVALLSGVSAAFLFGCVAQTLAQQAPAPDTAPTSKMTKAKKIVHHKPVHGASADGAPSNTPALPPLDAKSLALIAAMQNGPARFDQVYGYKGNNIPFPSYGDTLLQDYGGWRSKLAEYGFGLIVTNVSIFEDNMLNTPYKVPATGANGGPIVGCGGATTPPGKPNVCAGGQAYFGQRPAFSNGLEGYLTYDLSRWGVPDGQLAIAGGPGASTDHAFLPAAFNMSGLTWYQTLFDKKVEVKVGYQGLLQEFIAIPLGSSFASTFGPQGAIPILLGMSSQPFTTPGARVTWHITDSIYNSFGVARSYPMGGTLASGAAATGAPFYDERTCNPTGFRFTVDTCAPKSGTFFVDEIGYKTPPLPGNLSTWIRGGVMYNSSAFTDFSRLAVTLTGAPTPIKSGNSGAYLLGDQQLYQLDPSSPFTGYRGIYAGFSAEYAQPSETLFTQYYEGRVYSIGPFDSRPTDIVSFTYGHNVVNPYIVNFLNNSTVNIPVAFGPRGPIFAATPLSSLSGNFAYHATNSYTVSYLAHLMPGVYVNLGVSYTDHPSPVYYSGEGHSLNFLASTFLVF